MYLYKDVIRDALLKESYYDYIKTAKDIEY